VSETHWNGREVRDSSKMTEAAAVTIGGWGVGELEALSCLLEQLSPLSEV
jgi:hypothetical protein